MIYFIGAGPGDPDLITVKGASLLAKADVIIYAGSLVNEKLLDLCQPGAEIFNSAGMNLDEIVTIMMDRYRAGQKVVRLHTGDPSLYGAIQEQMDQLKAADIPYTVIPGVSSFLAAAAAIPQELTLPGVTQTVILTRREGRTPVPINESIKSLATHGATMCIFLSIHMLDELTLELTEGGYALDTPVAVVEKASWPTERIIIGTLTDITAKVRQAGITKTAMVIVGQVLQTTYDFSKLYDAEFTHGFREGKH